MTKNIFKQTVLGLILAITAVGLMQHGASAATRTWTGGGDATSWSSAGNWGGAAPVNGDALVFDSGASTSDGMELDNDISGLSLTGITFTGSSANGYLAFGNTISFAGEIRDQNTGDSINSLHMNFLAEDTITISAVQAAWLMNFGKFSMDGNNLVFRGYHGALNLFAGSVVGGGTAYVVGDRIGATMFIEGSKVLSPVVVKDKGWLLSSGTVGNLTVASTGYLDTSDCMSAKNFKMQGNHFFSISGSSALCANYGKVSVAGTVNLTGGKLQTKYGLLDGYRAGKGAKYTLISNDGTDRVVGTYKSRPEGSTFKIGVQNFKITYRGGTGNDVVLTRI